MNNSELVRLLDKIDDSEKAGFGKVTRSSLKSLLIAGCDPESNNFKEKFCDEYILYKYIIDEQ